MTLPESSENLPALSTAIPSTTPRRATATALLLTSSKTGWARFFASPATSLQLVSAAFPASLAFTRTTTSSSPWRRPPVVSIPCPSLRTSRSDHQPHHPHSGNNQRYLDFRESTGPHRILSLNFLLYRHLYRRRSRKSGHSAGLVRVRSSNEQQLARICPARQQSSAVQDGLALQRN